MRGGVSGHDDKQKMKKPSSPHAWGCFHGDHDGDHDDDVFPTCVGVFPRFIVLQCCELGLPHMRGGVSL